MGGLKKKTRPHLISQPFRRKQTIGGNAHESWCLLRSLPFVVGKLVPNDEPAWQLILDLKDIVELVAAPPS